MSRPAVTWKQVERYCLRRGYSIYSRGGDKIIVAPPDQRARRKRHLVRIGHRCCTRGGAQVLPAYLKAIERAFGITADDIRAG